MNAPIIFEWTGDAMIPLARFQRHADRLYVIGEAYPLVVEEERSQKSHNAYFASLHEIWLNLGEDIAPRFPSDESLRKWCLIKCGYADKRVHACASPEEALRFAAFVQPMDEFAIVVVNDAVVEVYTAQSQSIRAMKKQRFEESKRAVGELAASMIGTTYEAVMRQHSIPATPESETSNGGAGHSEQAQSQPDQNAAADETIPAVTEPVADTPRAPAERATVEPRASVLPLSAEGSGVNSTVTPGRGIDSAAPSLTLAYASELAKATTQLSLKEIRRQFWEGRDLPEDEKTKAALLRVRDLHEKRVKGEIDARRCQDEIKALVA